MHVLEYKTYSLAPGSGAGKGMDVACNSQHQTFVLIKLSITSNFQLLNEGLICFLFFFTIKDWNDFYWGNRLFNENQKTCTR